MQAEAHMLAALEQGRIDLDLDIAGLADLACEMQAPEFFWAPACNAHIVQATAWEGFLPMSAVFSFRGQDSDLPFKKTILTPKLHLARSLVFPGDLHLSSGLKKQARNLQISFNQQFDAVLESCVRHHGAEWLTPELQAVFQESFKLRHEESTRIRFLSTEVRNEGVLVAGELGYVWGSIYTSLSGFHDQSGAGNVQLYCLGHILFSRGISMWDLGMDMAYKRSLGACLHSRREFLGLLRQFRQSIVDVRQFESKLWDCQDLIRKS